MWEIRIHGRGGQGVVTAAEVLAAAAFQDGRHAQAFPSFGAERMGAPVMAFCRIDDREIRLREPVLTPDALIIQDATLLHQVDLFSGLRPAGYILIGSARSLEELGIAEFTAAFPGGHVITIPARDISVRYLGRPVPNLVLVGAFAALTGWIRLDSVLAAIRERFQGEVGEKNARGAEEAYHYLKSSRPQEKGVGRHA